MPRTERWRVRLHVLRGIGRHIQKHPSLRRARARSLQGAFALLVAAAALALARAQEPPAIELTSSNCVVRFTVNSTWHLVQGRVPQLRGQARFGRPGDFNTLQATVEADVAALTTDHDSRDQKMRNFCFEAARFPKITFQLERGQVMEGKHLVLSGALVVRGVTRRLVVGGQCSEKDNQLQFLGAGNLRWADFGIRDPSTFFAKLQPDVKVLVEIKLPKTW
ncbi:MAG: YceI family protein [Verrucomicrobia bacterium]|nr:YceI family protein [Verrucomicrobiota bacterium]